MLSITTPPNPWRTVGALAAIGLSFAIIFNVAMMIWHVYGFDACFAFVAVYCIVMMVVIIRL